MPDLRSRRRTALFVVGALAVTAPALWRATRTARWRADVRYAAAELPRRHVNAFRYVTPAAFAREAGALDSAVPHLSDAQVVWRLSALAALLEDGHTRVDRPRYTALLPLEVLWTDTGPWVVGADSAHAGLVGRRIVAVDGRPVAAVLDTLCGARSCSRRRRARADPQCKAILAKHRAKGKHYRVAVSHVARKLVHILSAVLAHERPYAVPAAYAPDPPTEALVAT